MDIKERLTQKVGPLPLWAWGAIGIGLIIVFSAYKRGDTSTMTAATDSNSGVGGGEATFSDANGTYPVETRSRSNENSGYGITDTASVDSATGYASDVPWTTLETTPPQTINNYYYNDNPTPGFVQPIGGSGLGRVANQSPVTTTAQKQVNTMANIAAGIVARPNPKPKPKPKPTTNRPGANSPHRNPTPTKPPAKKPPAKKTPAKKAPAPAKRPEYNSQVPKRGR